MNLDKRVLGSFWNFSSEENTLKRGFHGSVLLNNQLYVFGGLVNSDAGEGETPREICTNSFFRYNVDSGESTNLSTIISNEQEEEFLPALSHHTLSLISNRSTGRKVLVLFGGTDESQLAKSSLFTYDITRDRWKSIEKRGRGTWPLARYSHSANVVEVNGRETVCIFGGTNGESYFNDINFLDPLRWTWKVISYSEEKKKLTVPPRVAGHSSALWGHSIYIFGGGNSDCMLNSTYAFHMDRQMWEKVKTGGQITPPQRTHHAAEVIGNKMIVLGGVGRSYQHEIMSLNLEKLEWETHSYVSKSRKSNREKNTPRAIYGHSIVHVDNSLWIIGGKFENESAFSALYNLDTGIRVESWKIDRVERTVLPEQFASLVNDRRSSDVVFDVSGVHVYAHRSILRARCALLYREAMRTRHLDSNINLGEVLVRLRKRLEKKKKPNIPFKHFGKLVEVMKDQIIEDEEEGEDFEIDDPYVKFVLKEKTVLLVLLFVYSAEIAINVDHPILGNALDLELRTREEIVAVGYLSCLVGLSRLAILCFQNLPEESDVTVVMSGPGGNSLFADLRRLYKKTEEFSLGMTVSHEIDDKQPTKSMSLDSDDANLSEENTSNASESTGSYITVLTDFDSGDCACDFQIDVDEGKRSRSFFAHRAIIQARCPKLLARLDELDVSHGSSSEVKQTEQVRLSNHVVVDSIRAEVFTKILEFIYISECRIGFDIALELLVAAEEYDLPRLSTLCQRVIDRFVHVHNVGRILHLLDSEKIAQKLRESCVVFICNHLNRVRKTQGYRKLPGRTKQRIKEKRKVLRSLNKLDYQHEQRYSNQKYHKRRSPYDQEIHDRNFLLMNSHNKKKYRKGRKSMKKNKKARKKKVHTRDSSFGGGGGDVVVMKKKKKRYKPTQKEMIAEERKEKKFGDYFEGN